MAGTTAINGIPYPTGGDGPFGATQIETLAEYIDPLIGPNFASTALRDSTITSPATGQECTVAGRPMVYAAAGWRAELTVLDTVQIRFTPGSTLTTSTSSSQTTWVTLGNISVPAWATSAKISLAINGIYVDSTASTLTVYAQARIGSAGGGSIRITDHGSTNGRFTLAVHDSIASPVTGTQSVTVATNTATGTAHYSVDGNSQVSALIVFA